MECDVQRLPWEPGFPASPVSLAMSRTLHSNTTSAMIAQNKMARRKCKTHLTGQIKIISCVFESMHLS